MVCAPSRLPSLLDPLVPVAEALEAGRSPDAAREAMTCFRTTQEPAVKAWALALYGVAETRNGHFEAALDALDAAHELARETSHARLAERIEVDRLLPLAHLSPAAFARELADVRARVGRDPALARLFGEIERRLLAVCPSAAGPIAGPCLRLVSENLPTEHRIDLEQGPIRIGRRRECELQIMADGQVSRLHCEVVNREDGWHVIDVSSHGNTTVTGCRSPSGPLQPGARIQIGATVLRVCA